MIYSATPWLIFYKKRPAAKLRLFCLHYAGGSASAYSSWLEYLPSSIELVGIQLPGREGRFNEAFISDFDKLVHEIVVSLSPIINKPYVVFGHSMGALKGFEVIRELKKRKLRAPMLFIAAGRKPPQISDLDPPISHLPEDEFIEELLKDYAETLEHILDKKELRELFIPQLRADFKLCENYFYRPGEKLDCPILAYAGESESDLSDEELICWGDITNSASRSERFPGGHFFIHNTQVELLAAINTELKSLMDTMPDNTVSDGELDVTV